VTRKRVKQAYGGPLVCDTGVERHEVEKLSRLLQRRDVVVWMDIPVCTGRR
jgi:hypothetical protein